MRHSGIWSINGAASTGHVMDPLLTLQRDRSYVLALSKRTIAERSEEIFNDPAAPVGGNAAGDVT